LENLGVRGCGQRYLQLLAFVNTVMSLRVP
jgi:hypothetical protein